MINLLSSLMALSFQVTPPVIRPAIPEVIPKVTMTVRPSSEAASEGQWLLLACTFEIPEGCHIYWRNPGASGVTTTIEVETPAGFTAKPVVYPRPRLIPEPAGMSYGYEKDIILLVPIYPPLKGPPDGTILEFKVTATWLVCRDKCFFGMANETIRIPWSKAAKPLLPWASTMLAESRWPRSLSQRPRTTAVISGGQLVIEGTATRAGSTGFLPDPTPGVDMGSPVVRIKDGRFRMEIPVSVRPGDTLGQAPLARGLLVFGDEVTMPTFEVSVPILPEPGSKDTLQRDKEKQRELHP